MHRTQDVLALPRRNKAHEGERRVALKPTEPDADRSTTRTPMGVAQRVSRAVVIR